jgi:hypothetical protein
MKKVTLIVGLLLAVSLISACAEFDHGYRSDRYDDGGHSGHSHH